MNTNRSSAVASTVNTDSPSTQISMVPLFVYGFEEYMGWYPILAGRIDDGQ